MAVRCTRKHHIQLSNYTQNCSRVHQWTRVTNDYINGTAWLSRVRPPFVPGRPRTPRPIVCLVLTANDHFQRPVGRILSRSPDILRPCRNPASLSARRRLQRPNPRRRRCAPRVRPMRSSASAAAPGCFVCTPCGAAPPAATRPTAAGGDRFGTRDSTPREPKHRGVSVVCSLVEPGLFQSHSAPVREDVARNPKPESRAPWTSLNPT